MVWWLRATVDDNADNTLSYSLIKHPLYDAIQRTRSLELFCMFRFLTALYTNDVMCCATSCATSQKGFILVFTPLHLFDSFIHLLPFKFRCFSI